MNEERFQRKLRKIKHDGKQYKQLKEAYDTYAEYMPEHKKRKVSNIMLVVSVIAIVGYVVADFILQYHVGVEISPTITSCWFVFWTSEIFILAGIKGVKVIKQHRDNDNDAVG